VAAVAVLLVVTVTGLRARGAFARGPNQAVAGVSAAAAAIILSAAEGIAVIAFIIVLASARPQRTPKREEDEEPPRPHIPRWAKTLGVLAAAFAGWRRGPALAVAAAVVACAFSRAGTAVLAAEGLLIVAYLIVADAPAGLSPKARPGSWLRQQAPGGARALSPAARC
jgi:hypothetical protein